MKPMLCPRPGCNNHVGYTDGQTVKPLDADTIRASAHEPNGVVVYELRCTSCGKEWRWPK